MATTPMFAPDGTLGDIPAARVQDAVKAGYKMGVDVNSPDGIKGTIPIDSLHDAVAKGFSPAVPFTEAAAYQISPMGAGTKTAPQPLNAQIQNRGYEQQVTQENMQPAARADILAHQVQNNSITPVSNAVSALAPETVAKQIVGSKLLAPAGAALGPHVGLTSQEGATIAGLAGGAGATAVLPAMEAAGNLSIEAPDKINLPGGFKINRNVEPTPEEAAYQQNKTITEAAYQQNKTITEAQESALAQNAKFDKVAAAKQAALEQQAQDAKDALDAQYQQRGQDLMNRQAAQDKLDSAQTKAENALARSQRQQQMSQGEDMSAEIEYNRNLAKAATQAAQENRVRDQLAQAAEDAKLQAAHEDFAKQFEQVQSQRMNDITDRAKLNQQWASALNARGGVDNPQGNETPFGDNPDATGPALSPQDLISRTKRLVIPGEAPSAEDLKRAGDLTQATTMKLSQLARFGDELAKNELIRRLKQ